MKRAGLLFVPSLTGCLLVASLLSSCTSVHGPMTFPEAEEPQIDTPGAAQPPPARVQYGIASWYGRGFHGRPTASGETYNMYHSTAAHRTVPLGTYAVVTNLENGQATRVRINDRGPYIRGRIIDLSYESARQLNMVRAGSARVKVEFFTSDVATAPVVSRPVLTVFKPVKSELALPQASEVMPEPGTSPYEVQAGAYQAYGKAERVKERLTAVHPKVWINMASESAQTLHRVRLGPFHHRDEAERVVQAVRARGYVATVIALTQ